MGNALRHNGLNGLNGCMGITRNGVQHDDFVCFLMMLNDDFMVFSGCLMMLNHI